VHLSLESRPNTRTKDGKSIQNEYIHTIYLPLHNNTIKQILKRRGSEYSIEAAGVIIGLEMMTRGNVLHSNGNIVTF